MPSSEVFSSLQIATNILNKMDISPPIKQDLLKQLEDQKELLLKMGIIKRT